jgi:ADP-ribose pyrophosphatase YjhB (NUDIX family)
MHHPPDGPVAGVIAVVWRERRVLLVRRGNVPNRGLWAFPGGRQHRGETIVAAALRELAEETGLRAETGAVFTAFDAFVPGGAEGGPHHFVLSAVVVRDAAGTAVAADDAQEVGWFAADSLPRPAVPDLGRIARLSLAALACPSFSDLSKPPSHAPAR